jgi:hypothetical protein
VQLAWPLACVSLQVDSRRFQHSCENIEQSAFKRYFCIELEEMLPKVMHKRGIDRRVEKF